MSNIKLFESKHIRSVWNDKAQRWFFAVVDVVAALTDSQNPQVYWRVLKKRLLAEGNETVTNCNALKMTAPDGKQRLTDVADTEQLLRIIQYDNPRGQTMEPFAHPTTSAWRKSWPKNTTRPNKPSTSTC